jgi:hypothetical protein
MLIEAGAGKRIIIDKELRSFNHHYWLKCCCPQYEGHDGNNMDTLRIQQRTWNHPIVSEWFLPACSCCSYKTNNFPLEVIDVEQELGIQGDTGRIRLVFGNATY